MLSIGTIRLANRFTALYNALLSASFVKALLFLLHVLKFLNSDFAVKKEGYRVIPPS